MDYPLHAGFVLVYLLALIGVGALKAGKIKSQADFSLAGRGLSTFVLVGTLLATWIGTGSIFGNAQKTYQIGVGAFILPLGSVVGILLLYRLAARIRQLEHFTIQDILEARFSVSARVIGTVALLMAYVIIVSYQYRAGAAVIDYLLPGLKDHSPFEGRADFWGIVLVAIFVIAYTALAGMFSVAYTDVANGILMTIGIVLAIPILIGQLGGLDGLAAALPADQSTFGSFLSVLSVVNWVLPPFLLIMGDANMYQRFFSARDPGVARRSAAWMILGVAFLECAIIFTALLGRGLVDKGTLGEPLNVGHIVVKVAFEALPGPLGALLMGTIVAIIVSTADSYLLAPATSVVRDVYTRFLKPEASEREVVLVGRSVVLLLGLIAFGLAFTGEKFFEVALFAYTIYGASITPAMLAAFFWRRATRQGAVASMLTGVTVALVWQELARRGQLSDWAERTGLTVLSDIDAVLPALLCSVVALVAVSLLTPPPSEAQRASA